MNAIQERGTFSVDELNPSQIMARAKSGEIVSKQTTFKDVVTALEAENVVIPQEAVDRLGFKDLSWKFFEAKRHGVKVYFGAESETLSIDDSLGTIIISHRRNDMNDKPDTLGLLGVDSKTGRLVIAEYSNTRIGETALLFNRLFLSMDEEKHEFFKSEYSYKSVPSKGRVHGLTFSPDFVSKTMLEKASVKRSDGTILDLSDPTSSGFPKPGVFAEWQGIETRMSEQGSVLQVISQGQTMIEWPTKVNKN